MRKKIALCLCLGLIFCSCAVFKKPEPVGSLLEGKDYDFYFNQGASFLSDGDYNKAIENFSKALSLNPKSARALNLRGIAYFHQKNYRTAEEQFRQALALDASYAEASNNLGSTYFASRQLEKARDMFEKTLTLSPDSVSAHYSLGTLLLLLGEAEEGTRHLARGVELDPTFLDAHRTLIVDVPSPEADMGEIYFTYAKIYAQKGNVEKTIEYLTKAKQAGFRDWQRIKTEKQFEAVREDPRIQEFLR